MSIVINEWGFTLKKNERKYTAWKIIGIETHHL